MDECTVVEPDNGAARSFDDLQLYATIWMKSTSLSSPKNAKNKICTLYDSTYVNVCKWRWKHERGILQYW